MSDRARGHVDDPGSDRAHEALEHLARRHRMVHTITHLRGGKLVAVALGVTVLGMLTGGLGVLHVGLMAGVATALFPPVYRTLARVTAASDTMRSAKDGVRRRREAGMDVDTTFLNITRRDLRGHRLVHLMTEASEWVWPVVAVATGWLVLGSLAAGGIAALYPAGYEYCKNVEWKWSRARLKVDQAERRWQEQEAELNARAEREVGGPAVAPPTVESDPTPARTRRTRAPVASPTPSPRARSTTARAARRGAAQPAETGDPAPTGHETHASGRRAPRSGASEVSDSAEGRTLP